MEGVDVGQYVQALAKEDENVSDAHEQPPMKRCGEGRPEE